MSTDENLNSSGLSFISAHSILATDFLTINSDNFCFHTFRVEYQKNSEVNMMKGLRITTKDIAGFREHLILEERSAATIQKYIRDIKAFAKYAEGAVTRETVIAYKKHLQEHYAVRSVNSMLASINSLFVFLGWLDLKVKALKLQQQVFCPEEKELTKEE